MITIEIPILETPDYTIQDIKVDVAITFYQGGKMSLAKAARWCGLSRLDFQKILSEKKISIYSEEMFLQDLEALKTF